MLFTPKGFLMVGGAVLLVLGLIGFVALNGPAASAGGSFFVLDTGENVAHTALGLVALAAVYVPGLNTTLQPYYRWIVILVALIALFFAAYGFLQGGAAAPNTFGISNLEMGDNLLHLVVFAWAALAAFWAPQRAMAR